MKLTSGAYALGLDVLGGHGGGGGGGHGGGGHGGHGHGGGGRRFWGGGGWGWGGPYYDYYDEPDLACLRYGPDGLCLAYAPVDVLGMFDIQAREREMDGLKQVPVSVAQALLRGGQQAIEHARSVAADRGLPGTTARDNVFWSLQQHQLKLNGLVTTPSAMYPDAADLKKSVMQSFVEANAVDEGAAAVDGAWAKMWSEIGVAISNLPATVAKKIGENVSWMKWVFGAGVVVAGIVGYVAVRPYLPSRNK